MSHLIRAKVDNVGVNKVLVDREVTINLTPYSLVRKSLPIIKEVAMMIYSIWAYQGNSSKISLAGAFLQRFSRSGKIMSRSDKSLQD